MKEELEALRQENIRLRDGWTKDRAALEWAQERIANVNVWAYSRIEQCRGQEKKFAQAWQHREKHTQGPPQSLVEAWTERRALQAVLDMLEPSQLPGEESR